MLILAASTKTWWHSRCCSGTRVLFDRYLARPIGNDRVNCHVCEMGRRSRGFAGDISSGWLRLIFLLAGAVLVVLAQQPAQSIFDAARSADTDMNVCLTTGYDLVITEARQFHLGLIAYFAVGAYAVAIPTTRWGWEFFFHRWAFPLLQ